MTTAPGGAFLWIRRASRAITLAGVAAAAYAVAIEPYWIELRRQTIALPVDTPLRIVHLSDLHTRGLGRRERAMIALVEAQRPDLIVITGDTVAGGPRNSVGPDERAAVRRVLAALHAPLGVFAVLGNWEHWRGVRDAGALFEGTGVRLLVDDAAPLRPGLWIVGLEDACVGAPDVDAAFRQVPRDAVAIALLHSPGPFPDVAARAPLALAGHSHGGQVRLPFLPALWLPPGTDGYVEGWYTSGASRLYVSRGLGTSILPLRFFCRPEVAVIDVTVRAGSRPPSTQRSAIVSSSRAAAIHASSPTATSSIRSTTASTQTP
jgi:uncharacterized protein